MSGESFSLENQNSQYKNELSTNTALFDSRVGEIPKGDIKTKSSTDSFNPDRRVDTNTIDKKYERVSEYSPDNRVKSQNFTKLEKVPSETTDKLVKDYISDMKDYSDNPNWIDGDKLNASDLKNISPEKVKELREEFNNGLKDKLISQWEIQQNCKWPTYNKDVWITNKEGKQVKMRNAGDRYDAHHIKPLSLGGENIVSNITPIRVENHIDHRGVHSKEGSFGKLVDSIKKEL